MGLLQTLTRVVKNPIGGISLGYIILITTLAVFAYSIIPDNTENANQMHLPIHSKPPGFTTLILLIPNQEGKLIEEIPIERFWWETDQLFFRPIGVSKQYSQSVFKKIFPLKMSEEQIEKNYIVKRNFFWGTDKFGRDLFSRMVLGSRISLTIGFVSVFISLVLGLFLGGCAGFFGGKVDQLILWLINVIWSIPSLLMVIAITLALGKGFWQVFVAVGLTMWVEVARLVRGQVISIKEKSFVQAANSMGFSPIQVFFKHIFPLIIPSLIVLSTANFASAILIESGLSFLGIGAQPPTPSWGGMIKDHFRYILMGKAYLAFIPGLAIMSLVLAFMLLGNSLRDALDVKN